MATLQTSGQNTEYRSEVVGSASRVFIDMPGSDGYVDLEEISEPDTPDSGNVRVYAAAGGLNVKDDAGTVTGPLGTGGAGAFVGASAYRTTAQSIPNVTDTGLTFDAEHFDTADYHDTGTNPSRFTVPTGKAGKYLCTASVYWAANGTGQRYLRFKVNGSNVEGHGSIVPGNSQAIQQNVSAILDLADGDYVEAIVYQSSGGSLNAGATAAWLMNGMSIARIGV